MVGMLGDLEAEVALFNGRLSPSAVDDTEGDTLALQTQRQHPEIVRVGFSSEGTLANVDAHVQKEQGLRKLAQTINQQLALR